LVVMRAYSQDLRERIIRALEVQEEAQTEIAERFAVSLSFVEKLWRRWRRTGSAAALPHAGGRSRKLQALEGLLRAEVSDTPDITLATLCERVEDLKGVQVSPKTMCVELQRLQLPRKKSRFMRVSARLHG
jgi:transposase